MKRKTGGRPRLPRRRRGERRVAALLDAAAAAFAERGYQAATMTDIAARAGAAIGSLYQFFPSKEALAEGLLQRYAAVMEAGLAELEASAGELGPRGLAERLVARRLAPRPERDAVLALAGAPGAAGERARFGEAIEVGLARALRQASPALSGRQSQARAAVVLQVLRAVPALAEEDRRRRLGLVTEVEAMLGSYLAGR